MKLVFFLGCFLAGTAANSHMDMTLAFNSSNIQQIHLGFGADTFSINVGWVDTTNQVPTVQYGVHPTSLLNISVGKSTTFTDPGTAKRKVTMHLAVLSKLMPFTRYYYKIGTQGGGYSDTYSFMSPPVAGTPTTEPLSFIVFGDMGVDNPQSLPGIIADAQAGKHHYGVGVGDFAYDMQEENGKRADDYFNNNQPLHALTPFIVCPGNHENAYNFQQYTFRWNTNPVNTGLLPANAGSEVAGQPNNWWFSRDIGNVHFTAISTETWFYSQQKHVKDDMVKWLANDLKKANANRKQVPWIVVFGHRSMYCSCDGDCDGAATTVKKDIEKLFYDNGVDLFINGHEHNYERLYAVHDEKYVSGNGNLVKNPAAPVYIVTGDAGNREGHEKFSRAQPKWSAFRSNTFGYSRLTVHNDTHLYWEQIMTDNGQPKADYGKVIDTMWLIQQHHGPYAQKESQIYSGTVSHVTHLSKLTGLDGPGHKNVYAERV